MIISFEPLITIIAVYILTLFAITISRWVYADIRQLLSRHYDQLLIEYKVAQDRIDELRKQVAELEQRRNKVVTKKPVILVIRKRSPIVKKEEEEPEIPAPVYSPVYHLSPSNYDPNDYPIHDNLPIVEDIEDPDEEDDGAPWPELLTKRDYW